MKERYLGKLQVTAELLENIFSLNELNLIGTSFDANRKIVNLVFESPEYIEGLTWLVGEGQEVPNIQLDFEVHTLEELEDEEVEESAEVYEQAGQGCHGDDGQRGCTCGGCDA